MADNTQQKIINALLLQLKLMKTTGGYETDLGDDVREWDTAQDNEDEQFVDVRDSDAVDMDTTGGAWSYKMPLNIYVQTGGNTSRVTARKMVFDVFKCIGTNKNLSGLCSSIDPLRYVLFYDGAGSQVTAVMITIMVKFLTDPWGQ